MSRIFGTANQVGMIVRDLDKALKQWTEVMGVGPWFYRESIDFHDFIYRGEPCSVQVSVALANSGTMQFELIQPRNDAKSIYNDYLNSGREGLHHLGFCTTTFDADKARYDALNMKTIMSCRVGNSPDRIVFYEEGGPDAPASEIIEVSGGKGLIFQRIREAAETWDGSRPIRDFGELNR